MEKKKASDFRYNTGETKVPWAAVGENYNAEDLMTIIRFMMKGKGADYEKAMALMPPPRFVDPAEAIAQICEIRGDYETAITYYEKVIAIEKADWHETQGEAIDAPQRSIARLREKLASR